MVNDTITFNYVLICFVSGIITMKFHEVRTEA